MDRRPKKPILLSLLALTAMMGMIGCGSGEEKASLSERLDEAKAIDDPATRVTSLLKIAKDADASASLGEFESAVALAKTSCREIRDDRRRAEAFAELAALFHDTNNPTDAREMLRETDDAYGEIEDPIAKVSAACKLAPIYGAKFDDRTRAMSMLASAQVETDSITDPTFRIESLVSIAAAYDELDDAENRNAALVKALSESRALQDARQRADALAAVGLALSSMENLPSEVGAASTVFDEALVAVDMINEEQSRAYAFVDMAESLVEAGLAGPAADALTKAESSAKEISDSGDRDPVITEIERVRELLSQ